MEPLPLFYQQFFTSDSLLARDTLLFREKQNVRIEQNGLSGHLMPTTLRRSDDATALCLLAFALFVLIYRLGRSSVHELVGSYFFSQSSGGHEEKWPELPLMLFAVMTALEVSLLFYVYADQHWSLVLLPVGHTLLLGIYALITLFVLSLQQVGYLLTHAIFLLSSQRQRLRICYALTFGLQALLLFVLTLLTIYFDWTPEWVFFGLVFVLLFVKILSIFKAFPVFFSEKYGSLHFFIYFCALEAAPLLLLWSTLVEITNLLSAF